MDEERKKRLTEYLHKEVERLHSALYGKTTNSKPDLWDGFYRSWKLRVDEIGLTPQLSPLFKPLHIHVDEGQESEYPEWRWLRSNKVFDFQKRIQQILYNMGFKGPGYIQLPNPEERSGIVYTMNTLYSCRDNEDLIAATLVCASYQTHFAGRNARWNHSEKKWPMAIELYYLSARLALISANIDPSYHHAHTMALPSYLNLKAFDLNSPRNAMYFLALEHSILLCSHTLIYCDFKNHPDPLVTKALKSEEERRLIERKRQEDAYRQKLRD